MTGEEWTGKNAIHLRTTLVFHGVKKVVVFFIYKKEGLCVWFTG